MADRINYDTPDSESRADIDTLISCINCYLLDQKRSDSLKLCSDYSIGDFSSKVDSLHDFFYDIHGLLGNFPLEKHHYLWICSTAILSSHLHRFKTFFIKNFIADTPDNNIENILYIEKKLGKLHIEHIRFLNLLLRNKAFDLEILNQSPNKVFSNLVNLVVHSLETLSIGKVDKLQFSEDTSGSLSSIGDFLHEYYQHIQVLEDDLKTQMIGRSFPMLVQFLKTCYLLGESSMMCNFLDIESPVIHPKIPIDIINSGSVKFIDIINYYKFAAFNFLTISLNDKNKILTFYNQKADSYFKVLLNLPNLSLEAYSFDITSNEKYDNDNDEHGYDYAIDNKDRLVSISERQEISLLFVINHLLNLSDMYQLVNPDVYYKNELKFLILSLSSCLSSDIRSTCISRSSNSNISTIAQQVHSAQEAHTQVNTESAKNNKFEWISSIIYHGTYKEKHSLIVKFCEYFNERTINIPRVIKCYSIGPNQESKLQYIYSMVEASKFPGKLLYINAINKISKLLFAIGVKFLVQKAGMNDIFESRLKTLFSLNCSVVSSLEIKDIITYEIKYNNEGEAILHFKTSNPHPTNTYNSIVMQQLGISKTTNELIKVTNSLKLNSVPY